MYKLKILGLIMAIVLSLSCSIVGAVPSSEQITPPTDTPIPPTETQLPTHTPYPTYTPIPSATPYPTYTSPPPTLAPTYTPQATATPLASKTPTRTNVPTSSSGGGGSGDLLGCKDQTGGRQKVRVENKTGASAMLYLYGPENYACSISSGVNKIYIKAGVYSITSIMCGGERFNWGSHVINPTWYLTLKCP